MQPALAPRTASSSSTMPQVSSQDSPGPYSSLSIFSRARSPSRRLSITGRVACSRIDPHAGTPGLWVLRPGSWDFWQLIASHRTFIPHHPVARPKSSNLIPFHSLIHSCISLLIFIHTLHKCPLPSSHPITHTDTHSLPLSLSPPPNLASPFPFFHLPVILPAPVSDPFEQ